MHSNMSYIIYVGPVAKNVRLQSKLKMEKMDFEKKSVKKLLFKFVVGRDGR